MKNVQNMPGSIRDSMSMRSESNFKFGDNMSMSRFSSVSAAQSVTSYNSRVWQKEMQNQLSNLPKPQNDVEVDYELIISQLQSQIQEA